MGVEVVTFRDCKFCGVGYNDARPGKREVPAGYCSRMCHEANRVRTAAQRSNLKRPPSKQKRRPISPASKEQRQDVRDSACLVCRAPGPCHPAHIVDRSLLTEGQDDPLAVIPLCPGCHRQYDDGGGDIWPYLEPNHRDRLAFAVARHGLLRTLERVTNKRWAPVEDIERKWAA